MCLAGASADPSLAQTTRGDGGGQAAAARLQQQLRRLQAEKSELQTQNADLMRQLDETKARVQRLEKASLENDALLARREEALAAYKQRLEESFERIRQADAQALELAGLHQQTHAALQQSRREGERLADELQARTGALGDCEAKNARLYEVNVELTDRYEKKGLWDALLQAEPFTGIRRVQIESILEEYRYRIEDLRRMSADAPTPDAEMGVPSE
jgi:chromosome segregation ATPase